MKRLTTSPYPASFHTSMKIGILTQPLHRNYGGILQNWALQQVLKDMGHQPEMIFRASSPTTRTPGILMKRCGSFVKRLCNRIIKQDNSIFLCNPLGKIYDTRGPLYADRDFIRRIDKTKPLYSDDELLKIVRRRKYDAFIVGSDQVWRFAYTPNIYTYFLDFLKNNDTRRKIAFSASFGCGTCDIPDTHIKKCKRLLSRFDSVSVREHSGLEILKKDFGIDNAIQTLDPTLLLPSQAYLDIIDPQERHNESNIASYILDDTPDKGVILNDVCNRLGSPVRKLSCEYTGKPMPTVSQWLATIADSEFVVTDSFHGCVFSIIFRKPFIAIANTDRGLDRFLSLLKPLGLSDRLVTDINDFHSRIEALSEGIDYSKVTLQLDIRRKQSLDFLRSALD